MITIKSKSLRRSAIVNAMHTDALPTRPNAYLQTSNVKKILKDLDYERNNCNNDATGDGKHQIYARGREHF